MCAAMHEHEEHRERGVEHPPAAQEALQRARRTGSASAAARSGAARAELREALLVVEVPAERAAAAAASPSASKGNRHEEREQRARLDRARSAALEQRCAPAAPRARELRPRPGAQPLEARGQSRSNSSACPPSRGHRGRR